MNQKDKAPNRAVEGDEVWVLLNRVKADQWEQHKDFILNILHPAAKKVVPVETLNTRFLYQNEQNEDGTFTSFWLLDPIVENGNYQISDILKKVYGEEKAEEYSKLWSETLAEGQTNYGGLQSIW